MKPELERAEFHRLLSYDETSGVFRWRVRRGGKAHAGAVAGWRGVHGYWCVNVAGKTYLGHRLAWFMQHGKWPELLDHTQGTQGTALHEVRPANKSQNGMNRGKPSNNTSGFKGVSFNRHAGRWAANIQAGAKQKYLGLYDTAEEAHEVYCLAADMLHREFANYG